MREVEWTTRSSAAGRFRQIDTNHSRHRVSNPRPFCLLRNVSIAVLPRSPSEILQLCKSLFRCLSISFSQTLLLRRSAIILQIPSSVSYIIVLGARGRQGRGEEIHLTQGRRSMSRCSAVQLITTEPASEGRKFVVCSWRTTDLCVIYKIWGFHGGDSKNSVLWDVTPCGSCKNRRFGGT
jgi:hypothetical protein